MNDSSVRDRYITFDGLDCDKKASTLRHYPSAHPEPRGFRQRARYYESKLQEKVWLQVDDLFFIGSQLNNVYAFFNELDDSKALELLYQVEQECC